MPTTCQPPGRPFENAGRFAVAGMLLLLVASTPALGSGEEVGNDLSAFDLPPGATVTLTFQVTVDNPLNVCNTALSNQGTFTGTNFLALLTDDPDVGGIEDPTTTPLDVADLAITKDDGQTTALPGEQVTYTITVTNGGPSDAVGATVTDTFPAELTGVTWSCAASAGSSCTAGPVAGDVNDTVNLLVGGTLTYTATGTIDPSATGSLANTATVTAPAGTTDPNAANDSATDTDTLTPMADLAITKDDDADPPPSGSNLTYTIMVENLGPSDATGVTVIDNLPAGVTLVATSGCVEDAAGAPSCTLGAIPAAGAASYTIEVSVDSPPPASIFNTASVAGNEPDPDSDNDSDTEETTFDAESPEVTLIDSVGGSGDGELRECETARTFVRQLRVRFSEEVENASAADPASATNPANYRLVRPATPGAGFDTTSCAGGTGGDTVISVDNVAWNGVSDTATLSLDGGASLADGLYRLLVCGDIEDSGGNLLDGGNGTGTDFTRTFRVDRRNRLADGHFDDFDPVACTLSAWSSTSPASVELASPDADGSPLSGSAHNSGVMVGFDLSQCVQAASEEELDLEAKLRVDGSAVLGFTRTCRFYSATGCGGSVLGTRNLFDAVGSTAGTFVPFVNELTAPAGTASVRCTFRADSTAAVPFEAYLDQTLLSGVDEIFADGFESGDTSAWSAAVP